jgi:hypothetical protein
MKKAAVLFILFVFPIVAYLFFATGVNSFMYLPTLTKSVPELGAWQSLHQKPVALTKKITILGFPGKDILKNKSNYFDLNQKIYNKNKDFRDFQFVMVSPIGTEDDVKKSFADSRILPISLNGFSCLRPMPKSKRFTTDSNCVES